MVVPKGRSTILRGVCRVFWREASSASGTLYSEAHCFLARTSLRGCLSGYAQPIVVTPLCTGEGDTGMACAHPSVGAGSRVVAGLNLAGSGQCSEWLQTTLQQGGDFHRPLRLHVIICDPCFQRHPLIAPSCRDGSVRRLPPRMRTPAEPVTAPHPPPTTPPLTETAKRPAARSGGGCVGRVGGSWADVPAACSPKTASVETTSLNTLAMRGGASRYYSWTLPVWLLQLARRSQRSQHVPSPT